MKCVALAVVIASVILGAGSWASTFAQFPLQVHYLTDQQRASFSAQDSAVAPLWGSWEPNDSLSVSGFDCDWHWRCDIYGTEDAAVVLKAAGDIRGLYLLLRVSDNVWIYRQSCPGAFGDITLGDELSVLLDPLPPD